MGWIRHYKWAILLPIVMADALGQDRSPEIGSRYHLTARPWQPVKAPRQAYLQAIEGLCRFSVRYQDTKGAIIDPFLHKEHQYATPYFAFAVGTLVSAGVARDLLPNGLRAMEHSTELFAGGKESIPEKHGEFFTVALAEGLEIYRPLAPPEQWTVWRKRLKKPLQEVIKGSLNNWQTYAMKGEWLRQREGLVPREQAVNYIEAAWDTTQRARIAAPPWFLYHDRTSDPDTLSVEAVGRGNLLALIAEGYDGPSAAEIMRDVETATRNTMLLQDPSGDVPANGRTDDHVWVDVGYQLAYEVMAERALAKGDVELAGQFRHAALLAFTSISRWLRDDAPWTGSYYVTKNHFDPSLRVGYQDASQYSNYNGSLMFHLAEAWQARKSDIEERPTPAEIGGYAFALDREYASAFANAGGMQIQANLRGQIGESSGNYWTPLGIVRFAKTQWDSRLGPGDGALTAHGGISFAPEFEENGAWIRMASLSSRYEANWSATFVNPTLVRCAIEYSPKAGAAGPTFRDDLIVTPDGVLSTVRKTSPSSLSWGVTWPVLQNDGRDLHVVQSQGIVSTSFPGATDWQNFISLSKSATIETGIATMRSTFGDLRPVRVTAGLKSSDATNRTFVYPSGEHDPAAASVRDSFEITATGFRSMLGRVEGNLYIGRTEAGGEAETLSIRENGSADIVFDRRTRFVAQLHDGKVIAIESDRDLHVRLQGHEFNLKAWQPVYLNPRPAY